MENQSKLNKKVSRVCWNTNGWVKPSGSKGKSSNKDAFENDAGFGFEEWLFDTSKQIDGYCYGYLRSIASKKDRSKYFNEKLDISLYAIETDTSFNQRYWIGEIRQVEVIREQESKRIFKIYKDNGWYDQMLAQLEAAGIPKQKLNDEDASTLFSLRYKPNNLLKSNPIIPFERFDGIVKADYYNNLYDFIRTPNSDIVYGLNDEENQRLKDLENDKSIGTVEKEQLIKSRRGQGIFRYSLLKLYKSQCVATGIDFEDILVASHIKPWAKSNNTEKLDQYNGLLLSPNIDTLFDKGYISFDDDGKVMISDQLKCKKLPDLNLKINLFEPSKKYMAFHRQEVYKKKSTSN